MITINGQTDSFKVLNDSEDSGDNMSNRDQDSVGLTPKSQFG